MPGAWQIFGKRAEDQACSFLESRGYTLVERNFRTRFAEIDIIAQDGDTLVFLEVKARRSLLCGSPREAVTYLKQKRMAMAASWYLAQRRLANVRVRFDVVAMLDDQGQVAIDLIQNAFQVN